MRGTESPPPSNPLVAALLSGAAPRPLRISAARGVLPVLRAELLKILVVLLGDGDEEIRREAGARLSSFTEDEIRPLLEDPGAPPEVLDHFGSDAGCSPALREALVGNPATPAATLRRMIPSLPAALVDVMLLNQTRLIAHPDLLDLIEGSGLALSPLQLSRIAEMRHHFLRAPAPSRTSPRATEPEPAAPPAPAAAPAPDSADAEAAAGAAEDADWAALAAAVANAHQKIMKMNTSEKVQLAFKGTREERAILIKDSSRMVQQAVLESPKLTDNEVESISRMRSIGEDVLRTIAGNRDWMKSYTIAHALTVNPKTPSGIAMNLVSRLTNHDLKLLGADKNVPEVIRRQARKILDSRTQPRRPH